MRAFPDRYKALKRNRIESDVYSLIPIRYEDRFAIMRWRNEQIYHLRQDQPLTEADQENYFQNIVANLFGQEKPNQILFSYLEDGKCIGYGGLVHINWKDKNAEISFIMDTTLEKEYFHKHWGIYLGLIEQVAFQELSLHKIYTYAFDLRSHLYEAVEAVGFKREAVLKDHCFFEGRYKDVVIHSKIHKKITLRRAAETDVQIVYEWASDELTRKNSFSTESIDFEVHEKWWHAKMNSDDAEYYICEADGLPAGLIRLDKGNNTENFVIGIVLAPQYRGWGMAEKFLKLICNKVLESDNRLIIEAYIKQENVPSIKTFEKVGFWFVKEVNVNGALANMYQLKKR